MKIRFVFDFLFGLSWDRHRRALFIFPFPFLGLRIEFGGGVVQKALPAAIPSDDDFMLKLVSENPTATWQELKKQFGGMSLTRAITAKDRLLETGKIATVLVDVPGQPRRRVLAVM